MIIKNKRLNKNDFGKLDFMVDSMIRKLHGEMGSSREMGELLKEFSAIIKDQSEEIDNLYKILDRHEYGLG